MQTNPITKNLNWIQNTSQTYALYFKQDGTFIDITGWTIYFTVKSKLSDLDASAIIKKTVTSHTNATQGETAIDITTTDTNKTPGSYYYEIRYKSDEADEGVICNGRITIEKTVTQTT